MLFQFTKKETEVSKTTNTYNNCTIIVLRYTLKSILSYLSALILTRMFWYFVENKSRKIELEKN